MASDQQYTQLKNFLPLSKLGQGAFSTVYKVKRINDSQIYALKKIKMQKLKQKQKVNALNQIRILASIKNKFIISYKQAFYDHSLNLLCIVMEYANGGDLQKKITDSQKVNLKIPQQQIWKAAAQILIGLYVLHEKGILHRDLKSANVFISNDVYKLGDLNVSKVNDQKDQMARTQTGTPYYASPQVWRDEPYDSKCDIWSFGCLIYQMCCYQPPFKGADLDQLFKSVQKGRFKDIPINYSSQLALLIKLCLKLNPKQRLSAKQLLIKFKPLNQIFIQTLKNHQLQTTNDLLNTIRLPYDLKDLSKSLPQPQYSIKIQPETMYQDKPSQKETVMLKNKQNPAQNKILETISNNKAVQPLPQRIKSYFKQQNKITVKKRPQRPVTTSKIKQQKQQRKQIRPLSAHYINKKYKNEQKVHKLKAQQSKSIQISKIMVQKQILPISIKKRDTNIVKSIKQSNQANNYYNPNQYRCKSSQYQKRKEIMSLISPNNKNKNRQSQNRILKQKQNNIPNSINRSSQINNSINRSSQINKCLQQNLCLNQKLYENCKQNGIKKISSLQKKVKYIRDQRKQRKANLEKNKQNISSILKPLNNNQNINIKQKLKQKIKQNSQIFKSNKLQKNPIYMPIIKQRVVSGNSINNMNDKSNIIKGNLQNRRNNLISKRYIVSADSKRVRSYTQISNQQSIINQRHRERKQGTIRNIKSKQSVLPSIIQTRQIGYRNITNEPYIKRQINLRPGMKQINQQQRLEQNIIDNSQTIIRLKKRIKNRMIGHNSQQKCEHSYLQQKLYY